MSIVDAPTHHWTVEEYEKLGESFFGETRVELLNGQIIEMSPIGYRHAEAVDRLNEFFVRKAKERYRVRVQGPFILSGDSMPQPDVCLLQPGVRKLRHLPKTTHVFLAVEVADSTLGYDRGDKRSAYALQGIEDYWLLNLQGDVLEIYRNPVGDQYTSLQTLGLKEMASPLAFPDLKLRVGDFIP